MKMRVLVAYGFVMLAGSVWAGDFNVVGNMHVASNLTASVVTLQGGTQLSQPVLDFSQPGLFYRYILTNDTTWIFTNHVAGRQVWLQVEEDETGGWLNTWPVTLLWPANSHWNGSTKPNRFSVFKILDNGSRWLAQIEGLDYCTSNCSYGVKFDGSRDYAATESSSVFAPQGSFTIEFWEKGMTSDGGQFINQYDNWYSYLSEGKFTFQLGFASAGWVTLSVADPSDSAWHHMAVCYDGSNATFYLDGAAVTNRAVGADNLRDSELPVTWAIGNDFNIYTLGDETLDEVRISSVARYTEDFTPACSYDVDTNTVAYWSCDEGSGTTASDKSGNGHATTLEGEEHLPSWVFGVSCDNFAEMGAMMRGGESNSVRTLRH